jgi:hypothetical protein
MQLKSYLKQENKIYKNKNLYKFHYNMNFFIDYLTKFTEKYNTQSKFLAAIRWMLANIQFRFIRVASNV